MDPVEAIRCELATLFDLWRRDLRVVAAHIDPDLEPHGLMILGWLTDTGRARLTDIAYHYGVGKGTMSRQLKALEGLGLVERRAAHDDARAVLFGPTERARKALTEVWNAEWKCRRAQFASWDPDEVNALGTLLERFNAMSAS